MLTGLVDPFSEEAVDARYPDQGSSRTLTFQQRFAQAITGDANGAYALAYTPKANFTILQMASAAASVVTWAATYGSAGGSSTNLLNTYGKVFRPTSYGVRISNTLSATNSSGYLVIAKGGVPTLGGTTTMDPANFTSWEAHPMTQGGQWHVTGHPKSSNAYDFVDVQLSNGNNEVGLDTWETIYIAFFGVGATLPTIYIEAWFNYEYTPQEDAPIAQLASRQPVLNIPMQTAINHVQSSLPNSHVGGGASVKAVLKKEAKKALVKHVFPFLLKKGTQLLL